MTDEDQLLARPRRSDVKQSQFLVEVAGGLPPLQDGMCRRGQLRTAGIVVE